MNDYERAKVYILDKNNSLPDTSKLLSIPLPTLKSYRHNPEKMKTAAWERVHAIAGLYRA